ncbi:hypothetical protein [Paenibacillus turpanensis]|uniref:hypothetical protein n=1 Tax=Paenibacillus turpanensis TaxID=2689078 RepID=UPI00140E4977|nr:hypothetical protein [Paenibacillus turpanensis]
MNTTVSIPKGEEKVMVELTVKEAMALTGYRFNENPDVINNARKKIKKQIEKEQLH